MGEHLKYFCLGILMFVSFPIWIPYMLGKSVIEDWEYERRRARG